MTLSQVFVLELTRSGKSSPLKLTATPKQRTLLLICCRTVFLLFVALVSISVWRFSVQNLNRRRRKRARPRQVDRFRKHVSQLSTVWTPWMDFFLPQGRNSNMKNSWDKDLSTMTAVNFLWIYDRNIKKRFHLFGRTAVRCLG